MDKCNYKANFLLRLKQGIPFLQPWRFELLLFKLRQAPLQLEFYQLEPSYMRVKQSTMDKIALSIRPLSFGITLLIEILLLVFRSSHWLWWTAAILNGILLFVFSIKFTYQLVCEAKIKIHINEVIDNTPAVQTRDGYPGAGKTSSLFNDSKIIADDTWGNICFKYQMLEPFFEDIPFWPKKEREDAEEIIEAFNYYINSETYPCLWTTIPGFVDGVSTNKITADYLLQKERFPYGATAMIDEGSLVLPQELYKEKPYELVEICKFPRHLGDFKFSTTEQDENSNLIYFRRSSGLTMHMIRQSHILRSRFLEFILNLQLRFTKHMTKRKVNYFKIFKQFVDSIGYRKYEYIQSLKNVVLSEKIKSFIVRPKLNIEYDDRSYKNIYRCKNTPLKKSSWSGLRLSDSEIKEIFKDDLRVLNKKKK